MYLLAQLDKDGMIFAVLEISIQGYLAASSFPNSLSICFFSLFIFFAMRFFRVNCSDIHIVNHFTSQQFFHMSQIVRKLKESASKGKLLIYDLLLCLLKIILSSPLHMWIDWYININFRTTKKYFQDLQKRTYGMENLLGGCFVVKVSWGNFVNWNSNFWIHLSTRKR